MKKYILILVAAVVIINWNSITNIFNPPPDYSAAHNGKVVLYATTWCGYCKKARELFKANNIEYFEYDVEKSSEGREQFDRLGGKGVPLIVIDGKVLKGYDPEKIIMLAKNSK
jgi:Glutaredoxin and related proteins